jgi:hypothetical protein
MPKRQVERRPINAATRNRCDCPSADAAKMAAQNACFSTARWQLRRAPRRTSASPALLIRPPHVNRRAGLPAARRQPEIGRRVA